MTHFYSESQLSRKNRTQLWKICDQLNLPKRRSKEDCITEILTFQPQTTEPVEKDIATISYDGDSFESLTQPYTITVNGLLVNRTTTYAQAERFCQYQGYQIKDAQTQAQEELEEYIEYQEIVVGGQNPTDTTEQIKEEYVSRMIPEINNGYFELAEEVCTAYCALDTLKNHVNIPEDVKYDKKLRNAINLASDLVYFVFSELYQRGSEISNREFLNNCLSL